MRIASTMVVALGALLAGTPFATAAANSVNVSLANGVRPTAGLPVSLSISAGPGTAQCTLRYAGPLGARGGPHLLRGLSADKQVVFTVARGARLGRWTITVTCGAQSDRISIRVANDRLTRGRLLIRRGSLRVVARVSKTPSNGGGSVDAPGDGLGKGAGTGGYASGYCTHYVWTRRNDLVSLGHAGDWYVAAQRRGVPVGGADRPVVGSAAWWSRVNPQTSYIENGVRVNYGHIAYVEEVAGNRIRVSEMNWSGTAGGGWNRRSERWITLGTAASPEGYIYGGSAGDGTPDPSPPPDRDRDGVEDAADACPDAAGSPANRGCPSPVGAGGQVVGHGDFNGDGFGDVAVGAREAEVDSVADAGSVSVFFGSSAGLDPASVAPYWQTDAAGGGGLAGAGAESGDGVGAAVAVGDFDRDGFADLAVGVPGEDIGGLVDAGAVSVIYGGASGLNPGRSTTFWQTDAGGNGGLSGGGAEPGDGVGSALAAGDMDGDGRGDLAVGVPGEDIGALADAGAVSVIYGGATGLDPGRSTTLWQTDAGGAGGLRGAGAESGDVVGAALAIGDVDGDGRGDLAVGVPGEDIGALANAGAISVVFGGSSGLDGARSLTFWQTDSGGGGGLAGAAAEAGDRVGASLTVGDLDRDGRGDLAAWVPGEDVGVVDVGAVSLIHGVSTGLDRARATTLWRLGHQAASGWAGNQVTSTAMSPSGTAPSETPPVVTVQPVTRLRVGATPARLRVRPGGATLVVAAQVSSSGEQPIGRCVLERRGREWVALGVVRTSTDGTCRLSVKLRGAATVLLRVRFLPDPGWAPSVIVLKPIRLIRS